ncbi:MAG: SDR family oxidoreductase [Gemmatimonadales bacterium]
MLDDRTYLVTGATRGIGRATAEALARRGGRVILACRDLTAGEDVEETLRRATGNPELYVAQLDLSSLDAVRAATADVLDRFDRLDVLINNAGAFTHERQQNADGLELQFAVNHLGHFLLTHGLRNLLVASAPARVVTVSSSAYLRGKLRLDVVEAGGAAPYNPYQAYADSKLANVLFAFELARRLAGTGVTSNALHPGTVDTQMLAEYLKAPPTGMPSQYLSTDEGAATTVHVATATELVSVTGQYFERAAAARVARHATDADAARQLWAWSCRMTGAQDSDWAT